MDGWRYKKKGGGGDGNGTASTSAKHQDSIGIMDLWKFGTVEEEKEEKRGTSSDDNAGFTAVQHSGGRGNDGRDMNVFRTLRG